MEQSHVSALQLKHAGIERQIQQEMSRPSPDLAMIQSGEARARIQHDREASTSSRKAKWCREHAQVHATLALAAATAAAALT